MRVLTSAIAAIMILAGQVSATDLDVNAVRSAAMGKWEQFSEFQGKTYRLIKDVKEKEETLTLYEVSGEIAYQHVVEYEISLENKLAIFTYWNLRVIVNTMAGGDSTPADDVRHRYAFRIVNDKWYEAAGMLGDDVGVPLLKEYVRPQLPDVAIKELGYLTGNWTTEGRVGNIKSKGDWNTKWAPGYYSLTVDTGFTSEGVDRAGRAVGIVGWDSKNETIQMHDFWSFRENYTLSWKPVSDTVWEGELLGVEDGKQFTAKVKLTKKGPNEMVYESKNAAGEEIEVIFRK